MRWAVIFEGIAARAAHGNAVADDAAEVGALGVALGEWFALPLLAAVGVLVWLAVRQARAEARAADQPADQAATQERGPSRARSGPTRPSRRTAAAANACTDG